MSVADVRQRLTSPPVITAAAFSLLFVGLLIDLTTRQDLVIAVIYNIPIALTGLALSRALTVWTVALSLGANGVAAYENARLFEGYDEITLVNRGLSSLSFLLVGFLTLAVEHAESEVNELSDALRDARRERELRDVVRDLSVHMHAHDLVGVTAHRLRQMLQADALVISLVRDDRFATPRWSDGLADGVAMPGTLASWAVDAIPVTDTPAITVRSERGIMTTGRWRRGDHEDLIVVAARPRVAKPSELLGQALKSLEPLLHRAPGHDDLVEGRVPAGQDATDPA